MTGELGYGDIFYGNEPNSENPKVKYIVSTHIIFLCFLLFIVIVLMNLLVGLAVSDIQRLHKSAGLNRLVWQTRLIVCMERFIFFPWPITLHTFHTGVTVELFFVTRASSSPSTCSAAQAERHRSGNYVWYVDGQTPTKCNRPVFVAWLDRQNPAANKTSRGPFICAQRDGIRKSGLSSIDMYSVIISIIFVFKLCQQGRG